MPNDPVQNAAEDDWAAAMAEQAQATPKPAPNKVTSIDPAPSRPKPGQAALFEKFSGDSTSGSSNHDIDMIMDIPVRLTVELGRTKITIKQILQLAQGSVIELDGLAGEPMDVLVNGCLIAQGEVVVVNDKFGIRLTDIITPSERIRRLNK
jgi:flagellar motor switch protein FliN/FliY